MFKLHLIDLNQMIDCIFVKNLNYATQINTYNRCTDGSCFCLYRH